MIIYKNKAIFLYLNNMEYTKLKSRNNRLIVLNEKSLKCVLFVFEKLKRNENNYMSRTW
uniref:Uncharacterized protein n=1 Tax=Sphingobacterium sp. (strain 21) TaxID=743722 RepID=F4C8F0_SPHS2